MTFGGSIALSLFGLSGTSSSTSGVGSGFPGGSIAYYNYLAKNGSSLLTKSNNSQSVASAVQYFQSRVALITPAKATTLVRVNATLPNTDPAGTSHTATAVVYDSKGDK